MRTTREVDQVPGDNHRIVCRAHWVWCPGCQEVHRFRSAHPEGTNTGILWDWDGNEEAPTFSPSYVTWTDTTRCHSFLRTDRWEFLGDCTHSLAGQTVDMVDLPAWLAGE